MRRTISKKIHGIARDLKNSAGKDPSLRKYKDAILDHTNIIPRMVMRGGGRPSRELPPKMTRSDLKRRLKRLYNRNLITLPARDDK